jgi:hypothetical protein
MYDRDYPDIYKTRYDVPSWGTVLHDGEQYDTQNNNQYIRRDWCHPEKVRKGHQRYSS